MVCTSMIAEFLRLQQVSRYLFMIHLVFEYMSFKLRWIIMSDMDKSSSWSRHIKYICCKNIYDISILSPYFIRIILARYCEVDIDRLKCWSRSKHVKQAQFKRGCCLNYIARLWNNHIGQYYYENIHVLSKQHEAVIRFRRYATIIVLFLMYFLKKLNLLWRLLYFKSSNSQRRESF